MGLANETLKYTKWEIPDDFIAGWKGINTYRPWITGRYFLVVCHVSSSHWIVCRVNVPCWCIEVYDSHFYLYEGDKNIPLKQSRIIQCLPLSRLFSRLLESNLHYFTRINSDVPTLGTQFMDIQFAPREYQFTQEDSVSCGVYACMYMDLLLGNTKLYTGDEKLVVSRYRKKMAKRIFMISRGWRDW